jgi:hypothetical protein
VSGVVLKTRQLSPSNPLDRGDVEGELGELHDPIRRITPWSILSPRRGSGTVKLITRDFKEKRGSVVECPMLSNRNFQILLKVFCYCRIMIIRSPIGGGVCRKTFIIVRIVQRIRARPTSAFKFGFDIELEDDRSHDNLNNVLLLSSVG